MNKYRVVRVYKGKTTEYFYDRNRYRKPRKSFPNPLNLIKTDKERLYPRSGNCTRFGLLCREIWKASEFKEDRNTLRAMQQK
jgi:hypothetical protein